MHRPIVLAATRHSSSTLISVLDKSKRREAVQGIAAAIDIPFMSEDTEVLVLGTALDMVASAVQIVLPSSLLDVCTGADPVEISELKELVGSRVSSLVPRLPGIDADKQDAVINASVAVLIDSFFTGSAAHEAAASLSEEGRVIFLRERQASLEAGIHALTLFNSARPLSASQRHEMRDERCEMRDER